MVNSAEPPPAAFPSDLTKEGVAREAGGGAAEVVPTLSSAHRGRLMSLPSMLKPWGRQQLLQCVPVNRHGEAIAPDTGSSSNQQYEVNERLQLGLSKVAEAPGTDNPAVDKYPEVTEAVSPQPLKARPGHPRRLPTPSQAATSTVSASPQVFERERRSVRADARKRPRFSVSLSAEEIEEDIYSLTGALPRSRPRRRPRKVQKQIDLLFPGARLSQINAESYRVPDNR